MKKLSLTHITIASLMLLSIGGFYYGHQKRKLPQTLFAKSDSLFDGVEFKKTDGQVSPAAAGSAQAQKAVYIFNEKSVSRRVAITEAGKENYYGSIVSEVEGFRSRFYNDNTGYAIGNGWNVSLQTSTTNQMISQGIGLSDTEAGALSALSGNLRPQALPGVSISPEQATKAAQLMKNQFEQPMRKLVPSFDRLKENEKAALVYHCYKVGPGGASKYKGMLSALKAYDSDPSEANKLKVADSFTYTYKLNGKVMTDSRSKIYLAALFTSPEAYTYLLGTTPAPANFSSVAKLAKQNIDTSRPAENQIEDDFGKAKDELLKSGQVPVIELHDKSFNIEKFKPRQSNGGGPIYNIGV